MKKHKRKSPNKAKHKIDWQSVLVNALADLIIGTLLILIGKWIE